MSDSAALMVVILGGMMLLGAAGMATMGLHDIADAIKGRTPKAMPGVSAEEAALAKRAIDERWSSR